MLYQTPLSAVSSKANAESILRTCKPLLWPLITRGTVSKLQLSRGPDPHATTSCYSLALKGLKLEVDLHHSWKTKTFYIRIDAPTSALAEQHTRTDRTALSSPALSLRRVPQRTSICFSPPPPPSHILLQSKKEAALHLQSFISQKGALRTEDSLGNRWILSDLGANPVDSRLAAVLVDKTQPTHFCLHLRHAMVQRRGGLVICYRLYISNTDLLRQSRNSP